MQLNSQLLKKLRYAVSSCLLLTAGLLFFLGGQPLAQVRAANEAGLQLDLSAVVHGFAKAPGLPEGDLFLLPQPVRLSIHNTAGLPEVFSVNADTFGDAAETMGALANVPALGFSATQAGETVRATTKADNIGQANLILAGTEATIGDTVSVFAQNAAGKPQIELMRFTAQADGYQLTEINGAVKLFVDNRFALGPDTAQGTVIPYVDFAGPRGRRTGLLTFVIAGDTGAPLNGRVNLGFEIKRAQGFGISSIVLTDLVVKRQRVEGDENNPGAGLLGQTGGGYPSGLSCEANCR